MGALASAAASGLILYFGGYLDDPSQSGGHFAVVGLIGAYPATLIAVFFSVALVSAANAAIEGRRLSVGQALSAATSRIPAIAGWSLLTLGVGILLQEIASRLPWGGRLATWLAGAAWSLATVFVVPVLVVEDLSPLKAVRRSAGLFKQRWGEGLSGTLTIGAWLVVVSIPACMLAGLGAGMAQTNPEAATVLIAIGVTTLLVEAAAAAAVREIFALALYRYAVDGNATVFSPQDLQHPFETKERKGWWRRRRAAKFEFRRLDARVDASILERADEEGIQHGWGCAVCDRVFIGAAGAVNHARYAHRDNAGAITIVEF